MTELFADQTPAALPGNCTAPDFNVLKGQINRLSGGAYPCDSIKEIILNEYFRLEASDAAFDAVRSIDGGTLFVVAGQQAGLFGGPLYTLYKALHAVSLADRLSRETGCNVTPLFWVASDDHDFDEVRTHMMSSADGPVPVEYTPSGYREGMPVGDIMIDGEIGEALAALENSLPKNDGGAWYLGLVGRSWQTGRTWGDAFASWLLALLGDMGLVVFDPRWPGVKRMMAGLFAQEIDAPGETARLVNEAADAFSDPVMKERALRRAEGATNLFLETGGVREALRYDGGFHTLTRRFSNDEIGGILEDEPHRFSPAASLRPVCQDMLFPVAAMIAGPGERLYLSQLNRVYDMFGVQRSVVWPRASFTIVDHRSLRTSVKESITLSALFGSAEEVFASTALESFPEKAAHDFDALDDAIRSGFGDLGESIRHIDASLSGAASKELGRVLHITGNLRSRVLRAHKSSLDVSRRRITAATEYLLPHGRPQERVYGVDAIVPVIDGRNLHQLCRLMSPGEECHRIIIPE